MKAEETEGAADRRTVGESPPHRLDHVLLTRFNLPSAGVEGRIRAQEGWLRQRVELFERYCLPSVQAQSNHDFLWLVYFDTASPGWLRDRIERWSELPAFRPVFRDAVAPAELLADLEATTGRSGPHLLTTNLDNDDGLALDFVARLQALPRNHSRRAVYLGRGLIRSGTSLYARTDRSNAFCSVLETWDEPRTCWADWHNLLGQTMEVEVLEGRPAWLQVVHTTNVSNRVRGRLTDPRQHRALFPGLLDDLPAVSRPAVLRDRLVDAPVRVVAETARATAKGAVLRLVGKPGLDRAKDLLGRMGGR